jgi:hypothetical protein
MSKPVPVHADSPRPCRPACPLLPAPQCLTASQAAPPVHGVSTTRATTPGRHQHELIGTPIHALSLATAASRCSRVQPPISPTRRAMSSSGHVRYPHPDRSVLTAIRYPLSDWRSRRVTGAAGRQSGLQSRRWLLERSHECASGLQPGEHTVTAASVATGALRSESSVLSGSRWVRPITASPLPTATLYSTKAGRFYLVLNNRLPPASIR